MISTTYWYERPGSHAIVCMSPFSSVEVLSTLAQQPLLQQAGSPLGPEVPSFVVCTFDRTCVVGHGACCSDADCIVCVVLCSICFHQTQDQALVIDPRGYVGSIVGQASVWCSTWAVCQTIRPVGVEVLHIWIGGGSTTTHLRGLGVAATPANDAVYTANMFVFCCCCVGSTAYTLRWLCTFTCFGAQVVSQHCSIWLFNSALRPVVGLQVVV